MAAPGLHPRPRSSEYASSPLPTPSRQLPRGSCNWKDLNHGGSAFACGCKQFWLNDAQFTQAQQVATPGAWCFCGHHACFHSVKSEASFDHPQQQNLEIKSPSAWNFDDALGLGFTQAPDCRSLPASQPPAVNYGTRHQPSQSKVSALNASGLGLLIEHANSQSSQIRSSSQLPQPLYLEHAAAAHLPSTQSSPKPTSNYASDADFRQPRNPNTSFMSQIARQRSYAPQIDVHNLPPSQTNDDGIQSATEIATPSNAGTPALLGTEDPFSNIRTALDAFNKDPKSNLNQTNTVNDPQASHQEINHPQPSESSTIDQLMQQISWLKTFLTATPGLKTSLLSLQNRVDALENTSFSQVPVEEIQDKFEHFDARLLEIEARVDELEKTQTAQSNDLKSKSNDSFESRASFDQNGTVHGHHPALFQLATLEQRLQNLEATSLPSLTTPWNIEVVFLPWSKDLTNLWCAPLDASQVSRQDVQQSTLSSSPPATLNHSSSDASMGWTNGSESWLSPKACGPSRGTAGQVYERLKSRGFVRNITLSENSATEVMRRIMAAFNNFEPMLDALHETDQGQLGQFQHVLGLRAPFIPLRKVHKSSRLRHLTEAELITPSLWTPEFLNSGVFMQTPTSGERRLYITTPNGYLQSQVDPPLTWQKVRELPRYRVDASNEAHRSGIVSEADANEPCWAWNARLDPPVSIHSSFSSNLSYHSSLDSKPLSPQRTNGQSSGLTSEHSGIFEGRSDTEDGQEAIPCISHELEKRPRTPITPTSEHQMHGDVRRATSQPPTQTEMPMSATLPKRQIASFEHTSSPVKNAPPKRRRFSRNVDEMDLEEHEPTWSLTPRRSCDSTSPHNERNSSLREGMLAWQEEQNQPMIVNQPRKRGLTPQIYATPYSGDITMAEGLHVVDLGESAQDTDFDQSDNGDDDDGSDDDEDNDDEKSDGQNFREFHNAPGDDDSDSDNDDEHDDQYEIWEGVDD